MPNYRYEIATYRVVDGDTVDLALDLGFQVTIAQSCRLLGIDAPERATVAGRLVTQIVLEWFAAQTPQIAYAESRGWDKYAGRFDGVIYGVSPALSLNDYLLENKVVRAYSGGPRPKWHKTELRIIEQLAKAMLALHEAA
jgi:hypothetical protein